MEAVLFLTDGFEEIEAITTLDILRRGGVDVASVSLTGGEDVTGSHGITVEADMMFDEIRGFMGNDTSDAMLILPGGPGVVDYAKHKPLMELLRRHNAANGRIAAICAAPVVLGELGILHDKTAVCYPALEGKLRAARLGETPTVTEGNITTSKAAGTTMHFALELVRILKGEEEATKVAASMLA